MEEGQEEYTRVNYYFHKRDETVVISVYENDEYRGEIIEEIKPPETFDDTVKRIEEFVVISYL